MLRAFRILSATEPPVFFRRFNSLGAVATIDSAPWPSQIELELTIEDCRASPTAIAIDSTGEDTEAGGALPWQRLSAIERWLISHAPTKALRRDAELFYGIESAFNPNFVQERGVPCLTDGDCAGIVNEVDELTAGLFARLGRRQAGRSPSDEEMQNTGRYVGPILDELFEGRFGRLAGRGRMAAAVRTFARFGSGELAMDIAAGSKGNELAVRLTNGAPNGPMVFAFAEYALHRLDSSGDFREEMLWRDMLPGCILAAEMYLMAYHLLGPDGAVSKARFRSDAGGPRPLLRRLTRRCAIELMHRYLELGRREQRPLLESHLAGLLHRAFEPIEPIERMVSRPRRNRVFRSNAHRKGVSTAVFASLPRLEVRAPSVTGA